MRVPRDSAQARQDLFRQHDTEFRLAFDSLLAVSPQWRTRSGLDLDILASEHRNAVHDSILARDLRVVRHMSPRLRRTWWQGVRAEAGGSHQIAAENYAKAGDLRREAVVLGSLGLAYWGKHEWQSSKEAFLQALDRRQRLGDRVLIGRAWRSLGLVEDKLGHPQQALEDFRAALRVREGDDDRAWEGKTLVYIARDQVATAQLREAEEALGRATEALGQSSSASDRCNLELARADLHLALGELDAAIEDYRRIERFNPAPSPIEMSSVHQSLGTALQRRGEFAMALDELRQAKRVQVENSDNYYLAITCNSLGGLLLEMSQFSASQVEFQEAIAAAKRSSNQQVEIQANINLVEVADREGKIDEAERIALYAGRLAISAGDSALACDAHFFAGMVAEKRHQYDLALKIFDQVLHAEATTRDVSREIDYHRAIGGCLGFLGRSSEARSEYRKASALALHAERPDLLWTVQLGIADSFEREGILDSARVYNGLAIETLESLRRQDLADARRVSLLATQGFVYRAQIEVLRKLAMRSGDSRWIADAFEVAERFKARGLLDVLQTGGASESAPGSGTSGAELRDVDRELTMQRSLARRFASLGSEAESLAAVETRIHRLEARRGEVLDRMRLENPRIATLHAGKPLALAEVQRTLLSGKDTALLEYCLVDSAAYLFTVTGKSARLDRLTARAEIDSCVQVYRALLQDPATGGEPFTAASRALTQRLLEPSREVLRHSRRVILVPDGSLAGLPFETLFEAEAGRGSSVPRTSPGGESTRGERGVTVGSVDANRAASHQPFPGKPRYVLQDKEVCYGPSATVLAVLARERAKTKDGGTRRELLAVGRPAFDPPDAAADSVQVAVRGVLLEAGRLSPLPFSGEEVERIATLFRKEQCTVLLDRNARETSLAAPGYLDQYRILHFATHAIVDEDNPERSKLVLSFPASSSEDGFLHAYELYGLTTHADLVVLSACETGLGRIAAGEGVLGLPRAFFFAGASNVVVSLWSVTDESTSLFMQAFYRSLVRDGASPSAALARARKTLQADRRYVHPYYWAPFVLQGPDMLGRPEAISARK